MDALTRLVLRFLPVLIFVTTAVSQTTVPTTVPATRPATRPAPRPSNDLTQVANFLFTAGGSGAMAPAAVHVQVVSATNQALALKSLHYSWDFGDPASTYNNTPGWTSAHFYTKPGTYTVRLSVSDDNGTLKQFIHTVSVAPDTRRQVMISNLQDLQPQSGTHYYLARNQTYSLVRGKFWMVHDVVLDAAPGAGAAPVIYGNPAEGSSMFNLNYLSSYNLVFRGIRFESPGILGKDGFTRSGKWMGWMTGNNIAVVGCTYGTVLNGIESDANARCLLLQDNRQLQPHTIKSHFNWLQGTYVTCLGETGLDSADENTFRIADSGVTYGLVYRCSMTAAPNLKYPYTIRTANGMAFIQNTATNAAWGIEPRAAQWKVINCLFENNTLVNCDYSLRPGVHDVLFRGNTITFKGPAITIMFSNAVGMTTDGVVVQNTQVSLQGRVFASFYNGIPDAAHYQESGTHGNFTPTPLPPR